MKLIHGVDIVENKRVESIFQKHGRNFLERVFTEGEIEHLKNKQYRIESMAGLFAGKEAIAKALGQGLASLGFKNLEIKHSDKGKPYITRDIFKGLIDIEVSISHEKNYTIASCIGLIGEEGTSSDSRLEQKL